MKLKNPLIALNGNLLRHTTLKKLMEQDAYLYIRFNKQNSPCVYVSAKGIKEFAYYISPEAMEWIIRYLLHGECEDFGLNPENINILENDGLEICLMFRFAKLGVQMAYNPLIRENSGMIEAVAHFPHGSVYLRIRRCKEYLKQLEEYKQPIKMLIG